MTDTRAELRMDVRTANARAAALMALLAAGCMETGGLGDNQSALGAADDHTVLILLTTVNGGIASREAFYATSAGYTVELATATDWAAKSTADFSTYRAIVLGDPTCGGVPPAAALANRAVWGPAIDGNVILVGTDPAFHRNQGGDAVTRGAVEFAAAEVGSTGMYISLSCYGPINPLPLLQPFESPSTGTFSLRDVGCFNDAHRVADHPALTGITDASLSDWFCSVHEAFSAFPSDFLPLAIARDAGGAGTISFPDGSSGLPYIMARGRTLVPASCGNGEVESPEQCDDGNTMNCDGCSAQCRVEVSTCGNGVVECGETCDDGNTADGDGCSASCAAEVCGDGILNPGEQCDDGNTTDDDGCSSACTIENSPPVARCADRTVIADGVCVGDASIDDGSFDPDGDPIVCTQAPAGPYPGTGPHLVTLTCLDPSGAGDSCSASVVVVDATPPEIACPASQTLECVDRGAVATYEASATDNCGPLQPSCAPPSGSSFELGTTEATCAATDTAGNTSTCGFTIAVVDTLPPVVSTTSAMYWPPNHKYQTFHLADCATVVDTCDGPISLDAAAARITRVTSDEEEDDKLGNGGQGDGDTCDDIVITGDQTAELRVERMGHRNGRAYTVHFEVTDQQGNVTAAACAVGVPHDQAEPIEAPDDGCRYCVGAGCGSCPGHDPTCAP